MNIDFLNAYCSSEFFSLLCLAQGRLHIHQAFACIGLSLEESREWPQVLSFEGPLPADSRGIDFSWVGGSGSSALSRVIFFNFGKTKTIFRPEIRQGYPPNLSILISGGKENNCDSVSNGE